MQSPSRIEVDFPRSDRVGSSLVVTTFDVRRPIRIQCLSEFGQTVIVFRLPRSTQPSSNPALRQTVGNEFVVPNLAANAQVLLELGDEGPRGDVPGSAPEPNHGWS